MRLIDADEFLQAMKQADEADPDLSTCWSRGSIRRIIEGLPTIEAAPVVHGRWRKYHRWNRGIKKDDGFTASCCGRWNKVQTAYCPNCGARMDGDGDA